MKKQELEVAVNNLDARVERIEQILPTLATKADLADAVQPLATKDELAQRPTRAEMHEVVDRAIRAAIEPLATREEMLAEGERTRRHFDIVAEQMRADVRLVAEGHGWLAAKLDTLHAEMKDADAALDRRVIQLELKTARPRE